MTSSQSARSNTVDGVTGDVDIAETWRCHYHSIFNSVKTVSMKQVCPE